MMAESDKEEIVNGGIDKSEECEETIEIACENPLVKFIRGFSNVPEEAVRKMRNSDLKQKDWSALSDDDLKLFGFENEMLRREMLVEFANTPHQALHYDKFLANMDADQYRECAYKNIQDHLHQINRVLHVTQNVLNINPIRRDRLVNNLVYVSSLNKKAAEEIFKAIARITNSTDTKRWPLWLWSVTALGALGGGLIILRKLMKI